MSILLPTPRIQITTNTCTAQTVFKTQEGPSLVVVVVKDPPTNAGTWAQFPTLEYSTGQLSPCSAARETTAMKSLCTTTGQQPRPATARESPHTATKTQHRQISKLFKKCPRRIALYLPNAWLTLKPLLLTRGTCFL